MITVFFDIDTQIDFVFPAGALYVPGAEKIVPAVARLNRHAMAKQFPLVSTMCAHGEDDPEFKQWPPHCVVGTPGQSKPAATLVGQTFLPKQQIDAFSSPELWPLLNKLAADHYVVYGVVTEYCVKFAAMGLLETGKPVTVLSDACRSLSEKDSSEFFREFTARGGVVASISETFPDAG